MHQNRGFQTISIVLSSLLHCYEAMIKTSVEERYRIKGDEEKKNVYTGRLTFQCKSLKISQVLSFLSLTRTRPGEATENDMNVGFWQDIVNHLKHGRPW